MNSASSACAYISAKRFVAPSIETGSIALSVEIITRAPTPASTAASATLIGAEDVRLDALGPVLLEIGHVLQRRGVEHHVGAEVAHHLAHARPVAHVRDDAVDARCRSRRSAGFSRMWCSEGSELSTIEKIAAPRTPPRAAQISEPIEPPPPVTSTRLPWMKRSRRARSICTVGPQQQILDLEGRELRVAHALAEARHARERQAEAAGAGDEHVGIGLRRERARRRDEAADRDAALLEILHDLVEVAEIAEHRDAADRLAEIVGPVREDALRLELPHRSGLDRAQDHLDVAGPARAAGSACWPSRSKRLARARVFEVAEGEARPAEQEHLHEPVERDGDLAEEVEPEELRRDQDVVDDEQQQRQDGRGPEDVEEVRQRGEAPPRPVEVEEPVDEARGEEEGRQEQRQLAQALVEERTLEAHGERRDDGDGRRHEIVRDDERLLEIRPIHEPAVINRRGIDCALPIVNAAPGSRRNPEGSAARVPQRSRAGAEPSSEALDAARLAARIRLLEHRTQKWNPLFGRSLIFRTTAHVP